MRKFAGARWARVGNLFAAGALLMAAGALTPAAAQGTTSTTFQVLVDVDGVCSVTAVDLNFGTYDPVTAHASSPNDATGSVDLACTTGVTASIALDLGDNASGSTRRMLITGGGTETLTYEIYADSGRTTVWGADAASDVNTTAAPSITARSYTTYGRMPAAQNAAVGSYSDSITVTVVY